MRQATSKPTMPDQHGPQQFDLVGVATALRGNEDRLFYADPVVRDADGKFSAKPSTSTATRFVPAFVGQFEFVNESIPIGPDEAAWIAGPDFMASIGDLSTLRNRLHASSSRWTGVTGQDGRIFDVGVGTRRAFVQLSNELDRLVMDLFWQEQSTLLMGKPRHAARLRDVYEGLALGEGKRPTMNLLHLLRHTAPAEFREELDVAIENGYYVSRFAALEDLAADSTGPPAAGQVRRRPPEEAAMFVAELRRTAGFDGKEISIANKVSQEQPLPLIDLAAVLHGFREDTHDDDRESLR